MAAARRVPLRLLRDVLDPGAARGAGPPARCPAAALRGDQVGRASAGSVVLVLASIAVTTFDGAGEGALASPINSLYNTLQDAGLGPIAAIRVSNSLFLALTFGFVFGLFWAGIYGMHTVRATRRTLQLGRQFAHAFIPIALAYLVAHYFSLFVFQEQAQFTFLLSDPLGDGSDLFGTAGGGIDYTSISANTIWYVQVGALIVGHVTALVLGHDRALQIYGDAESPPGRSTGCWR